MCFSKFPAGSRMRPPLNPRRGRNVPHCTDNKRCDVKRTDNLSVSVVIFLFRQYLSEFGIGFFAVLRRSVIKRKRKTAPSRIACKNFLLCWGSLSVFRFDFLQKLNRFYVCGVSLFRASVFGLCVFRRELFLWGLSLSPLRYPLRPCQPFSRLQVLQFLVSHFPCYHFVCQKCLFQFLFRPLKLFHRSLVHCLQN